MRLDKHETGSNSTLDVEKQLVDAARMTAYGERFRLDKNLSAEKNAETLQAFYNDQSATNLDLQKTALVNLIRLVMPHEEAQQARKYMSEFETATVNGQEVAKTYAQLNVLLSSPFGVLNEKQRAGTTLDFLYHSAEGHVDQGFHETCSVDALEKRTIARRPSLAAEIITSAAITGDWVASDGKLIEADLPSLNPGPEERHYPPLDGKRSQASQIFQAITLDDVGERLKSPLSYIQKPQSSWAIVRNIRAMLGYGTGEFWKGVDGHESQFTGLTVADIVKEEKRLMGDTDVVLVNLGDPNSNTGWHLEKPETPWRKLDSAKMENLYRQIGANTFTSIDGDSGLQEKLRSLKRNNQFPALVGVDLSNNELPGSSHWLPDLDVGADHAVTINDYDPSRHRVYIENSFGTDSDGWISIQDLYNASL